MKVAISVKENQLDAAVDPRFGRCAHLIVVDTDTMEIVGGGRNEYADAAGGAGTQTAQWVIQLGAEALLTGNLGPNAFNVIKAGKIRMFTGVSGTARDAVKEFLDGKLTETHAATSPRHAGMGRR